MQETRATLIYLDNGMILSKKAYDDWREIQDEYWEHYQANFAPWTCEMVIHFFAEDFGPENA